MLIGLSLAITQPGGGGVSLPSITLSASTIAEDASIGATVGTFSVVNGSGTYTYTLTDNAGGKFSVNIDALEVAAALDYETATSHSITVEADNGVDPVVQRSFTVYVTDVAEGGGETASLYWWLPTMGRAA